MNDKAGEMDLRVTLAVLLVVYVFNFLDRQIVTILADWGHRYMSKMFNPEFLKSKGLPTPSWLPGGA